MITSHVGRNISKKVTPDLRTLEHKWASEFELPRSGGVFWFSSLLLGPFFSLGASFQAVRESVTQVCSIIWSERVCCSALQLLALFLLFVPCESLERLMFWYETLLLYIYFYSATNYNDSFVNSVFERVESVCVYRFVKGQYPASWLPAEVHAPKYRVQSN